MASSSSISTELGDPLASKSSLDFHNTLIINLTTYVEPTTINPGNNSSTSDEGYAYYDDYEDEINPDVRTFIYVLFILLSSVVFLAGIIGNCLVWFAVWRNPRMRSATNMFLVNLALADFLVVLICLPPTVAEDITGIWYLGREMCKVIKCLQRMSVFVSVMTLTAISMERWMAICRPLFFRPTTMVALRTIAIIWIISLICTIPQAISLDLAPISETEFMCQPSWPEEAEAIHLWIVFTAFYIVPLAIMTFTYVKIALCLWRSGLPDADNDEASANVPRAQLLLRRKKAKMLIMVVAMFALCFLPVHVLFMLMYTGVMMHFPMASIKPLFLTSHWLVYFSSAVNPIIYNFMSCNFRREFLIACHICCRRGSNHNSVYEAVRMRKFHKFQNRRQQQRAFGRNGVTNDNNSLTMGTQTSVLGNTASSSYSICTQQHVPPPTLSTSLSNSHHASGANVLSVPGAANGNNHSKQTRGGGGGDSNSISPCSSRKSSPSGSMRNQILQKNHCNNV